MSRKKKKVQKPWKWLLVLFGLFAFLMVGGCAAMMSVGSVLMDKDKVQEQIQSSIIYDKEGKEVTKLFIENREYVDYQNIPPLLVSAFVNTEDERFFTHSGIDAIAIGRAIYKDILAGSAVEGASTITQQLARNVYLAQEAQSKSIWRKTKEALIALSLERNYSKEQILEFYLNEIYLGHGAYGVKAAAKHYFGVDNLDELSLAEIATLAALPKAPNNYSPIRNYEKSVERRNVVLSLMEKNGSITKEERITAGKEKLELVQHEKDEVNKAQTYIDYVMDEVEEKFGITEDQVYRGGFKIYTELDPKAQNAMADAFENSKLFPKGKSKEDMVQAGMVIMDPHTGAISAMMGGRDYVTKGFNRALARRSPGSTFKPLAVYAPALEKGYGPYDLLKDEKMTFPGGYSPSNWNGDGYWGRVTMYDALKRSKNVPAVWLLSEIGIDTSFRYLDRFGITYDKQADRKLGIALGDLTKGVSPLEMAKAYSAFANNGVILEPHAISKIEDRDGIVSEPEINTSTVMSDQNAYYMTMMLKGVVDEGTGRKARMNRPVAGKTGTSQMEGTSGNRDAWFVGYTPELVGAIWMGYDKSDSKTHYLTQGSEVAANFFSEVMSEALEGQEIKPFAKPKGIKTLQPPVVIKPVNDLAAEQLADSIHLTWSGSNDKRIIYRVFRYFEDPAQKELIGETEYSEWVDLAVPVDRPAHYLVVPFNTEAQKEGDSSNVVEILPAALNPELAPPEDGTEQEQNPDGQQSNPEGQNPDQSNPNEPGEGNGTPAESSDQQGVEQQGSSPIDDLIPPEQEPDQEKKNKKADQ